MTITETSAEASGSSAATETYAELASIDPIEIAQRAIIKLRAHGLSGYVDQTVILSLDDSHIPDGLIQEVDQVADPPETIALRDNVADLKEFREKRNRKMTPSKQLELVKKAKQGDMQALEQLWLSTRDLAEHIAKISTSNWPLEDKIQVCLAEVPGAVSRFEPSNNASFNTFLYTRMQGALLDEERKNAKSNGLSRHDYAKVQAAIKSEDPKSALHELTKPKKDKQGRAIGGLVIAPHLVLDEAEIVSTPLSLEGVLYDEEGNYHPGAEPSSDSNVVNDVLRGLEATELKRAVELLSPREQFILKRYHGLFGETAMTQQQIGSLFDITESRVSQIRTRAIEKLTWIFGHGMQPPQKNRLKKLDKLSGHLTEMQKLHRIADALEDLDATLAVNEVEIKTVVENLSEWDYRKIKQNREEYWELTRAVPESLKDQSVREIQQTVGHDIKIQGNRFIVKIYDINALDLRNLVQAELDIIPKSNLDGYEYNDELARQFSARQREIIGLLYKTYGEIALELDLGESTVRSHVSKAMSKLGIEQRAEFAVMAVQNGLLDLQNVPEGRVNDLSPQEIKALVDNYAETYQDAAKDMGISISTFRVFIHKALTKLDAVDRTEAILKVMKAGLLPAPGLPSEANDHS